MKIRPRSSSAFKLKVTGRCKIVALLLFYVATVLVLAPTYRRLLDASQEASTSSSAAARAGAHGPAAVRRRALDGAARPSPTAPEVGRRESRGVPYIGEDAFHEKYAKYNGLLPAPRGETPDPACGKRPDFFDFFLLPKTERSRFHEDKIIYDLFKNNTYSLNEPSPLPRGTYVELGAFDGRDESNTMFFDKCLGWDGLLIEAQSKSYEQVIDHRPHAVKLSFSPTCQTEGDVAKFYDIPLSNNGMEGLAKSYAGRKTVEVPCGPLTSVLQDVFGPDGQVSFFSLDVEGAEIMVLEALDLEVLHVDVLMVEIQNTYCPEANCPSVHKIRMHMAKTGKYALFAGYLEASDVYIRWGTEAWKRATAIQRARKEQLEREVREHMMRERQQLIG